MKVITEVTDKRDFSFWSGAIDTVNTLTDEEFENVISQLDDIYPNGISDGDLNDIFWFENDWIAELLGYDSWEDLEADGD